jgi:hypothetical protein
VRTIDAIDLHSLAYYILGMERARLIGQRFGNLVVIDLAKVQTKNLRWLCQCDCGEFKEARGDALKVGGVTSCGCFGRERHRIAVTRHGMTLSPTWISWKNMRRRCDYAKDKKFYAYGAKGIKVCSQWECFENFFADMGERPKGMTLDRINGRLGYFPANCRWATPMQQRHNRISP